MISSRTLVASVHTSHYSSPPKRRLKDFHLEKQAMSRNSDTPTFKAVASFRGFVVVKISKQRKI